MSQGRSCSVVHCNAAGGQDARSILLLTPLENPSRMVAPLFVGCSEKCAPLCSLVGCRGTSHPSCAQFCTTRGQDLLQEQSAKYSQIICRFKKKFFKARIKRAFNLLWVLTKTHGCPFSRPLANRWLQPWLTPQRRLNALILHLINH